MGHSDVFTIMGSRELLLLLLMLVIEMMVFVFSIDSFIAKTILIMVS